MKKCHSNLLHILKAVVSFFLLLVPVMAFSQREKVKAYLITSHEYFEKKKFKEAALFADSAKWASTSSGSREDRQALYRWLSEVHYANKEYEQAMADIREEAAFNDSLAQQGWRAELDSLNVLLIDAKATRQNDSTLHTKELVRIEELSRQGDRNSVIIFTSVLALLIVVILALNRMRIVARRDEERALKHLRDVELFKEKLFAVLSFDLPKSLTAFENLTSSLSKELNALNREESLQLLSQLHSTSGELKSSIVNVIHWIALQANAKPFRPTAFDVQLLANRVVGKFMLSLKDKQLTSQVFIPDLQSVFADEEMIEIVLDNLMSNAIQFTHKGGTITVFSGKKDGLVMVGVKDTGVGISEENCRKLFEMSEDFRTIGTPSHKGAGIGLILAKDLVERNGGRIYVESTVGQGSMFYFTLPEKKID